MYPYNTKTNKKRYKKRNDGKKGRDKKDRNLE